MGEERSVFNETAIDIKKKKFPSHMNLMFPELSL